MAALFGGTTTSATQAQQPTAAAGVTVQTSCYGKAIPVVVGTAKLAPNLSSYGEFRSIAHTTSSGGGGGGGKGGGGGGGNTSTTSYTYTATIGFCLCEGPIVDVGAIWQANNTTPTTPAALGYSVFLGTYPQAGWSHWASWATVEEPHTIPSSAPYTVTVDWPATPFTDKGVIDGNGETFTGIASGAPAAGQYIVSAGTYGFAAADAGRDVTISYTSGNQEPPNQALGYNGFAYIAAANYDLGDSAQLPNHNIEVKGFFSNSVANSNDADPSLFISGLLTNPKWGLCPAFPAAMVGDLSLYQSYCRAAGLLISSAFTEQTQASAILTDLATYTNSDVAWTGGSLTMISRGDAALTGNGVAYTPPGFTFALGDDDWLDTNAATTSSGSANTDPLVLTRKRPQDVCNEIPIEICNRANSYNAETISARDLAAIQTYGLNKDTASTAHLLADASVARRSAQLILQRRQIMNTYQGTVGEDKIGIDIGDIGTISNALLGIGGLPVRVIEITEQSDGSLLMVFEDYAAGSGTAADHSYATNKAPVRDLNVSPGDALPPVIFDAPTEYTGGALELWLATGSASGNWAGCQVLVSSDDATYRRVGTINGGARMGVLTAALPAGSDPDASNILAVDLSESAGTLLSGTKADADAYNTLCWAGGELLSYETATLTATNRYSLSYLRRGAYNTTIAAHAAGDNFVRVDPALFAYPYTKDQIGQTIYVKLLSFNPYGGGLQDISQVTATSHIIAGPPRPPTPTGFTAQQSGAVVVFSWDASDYAVDIAFGPKGCTTGVTVDTAWAAMSPVTEAARGTEMTNAAIQPGAWTFGIRARNAASDMLSTSMATVDLTVTNAQEIVITAEQAPLWNGTLTGFVRHYTGVLIPASTLLAKDVTEAGAAAALVPSPVAVSTCQTPVIDTGLVDQLRVWAVIAARLGPGGQGNVSTSWTLNWSRDATAWQAAAQAWTVGYVTARYLQATLAQDNGAGACIVTGFGLTADVPAKSDAGAVTAAPGGTVITFNQPFHAAPNVQVTPAGAGLTGASAINVSATGCTLHAFTGATDSGGPLSWRASGS